MYKNGKKIGNTTPTGSNHIGLEISYKYVMPLALKIPGTWELSSKQMCGSIFIHGVTFLSPRE